MDRNLEKLVDLLERDREIFQLLRQCPYEILRHFEVRDYDDDQFVLSQGEIHNKFYIIASGYVDIYVESSHGKKYLLCTYVKGDYIGELEIFQQTGYISQVQSRGKVTVYFKAANLPVPDQPCRGRWKVTDGDFFGNTEPADGSDDQKCQSYLEAVKRAGHY